MEILDQHDGIIGFGFLHDGQREPFINFLVLLPICGPEYRTHVGQMAKRPDPFICEPIVIAGFFFRGDPDSPDIE